MLLLAQNSDIRTLDNVTGKKKKEFTRSKGKMEIKDSQKYPSIKFFLFEDINLVSCQFLPATAKWEGISYFIAIVAYSL